MTMDRTTVEDRLEEYVLDLLDDDESRAVEEVLAAHPDLAQQAEVLRRGLEAVAPGDVATPPALRPQTLAAAVERRSPGRGDGVDVPASGRRCRLQTVEMVSNLLDELDDRDMVARTVYGVPVVELVRHLTGVEADLTRTLTDTTDPAVFDSATPEAHRGVRDASDPTDRLGVVTAWRRASETLTARLADRPAELMGRPVVAGGRTLSVDELLVVRAFELWTHVEDICRATARHPRLPAPDVIHPMADLAATLAVSLLGGEGSRASATVRVTLTGRGGGSWVRRIGPSDVDPGLDVFEDADATLVADVVDFCRLAADRAPGGIEGHRSGDRGIIDELLSRAPMLADYGAGSIHR